MDSSHPAITRRSGRLARHLGNLLLGLGLVLLLGVSATWGYAQLLSWQAEQERHEFIRAFPTPALPPATPVLSTPVVAVAAVATPTASPVENSTPTATPTPSVPVWQTAPPPLRITMPTIDVDSKVVPAEVKDGTWEVQKFVVGHLDGTGRPTEQSGNVVLSGHLESLTSGNVFARLNELALGESIVLYTADGKYNYKVSKSWLVKPEDIEVTFPTIDPVVTLITCEGDWDPVKQDYTQRRIVTGKLTAVNGNPVD